MPRCSRDGEEKLATIQRAKKTPKRMRAKIANRRKVFLHNERTKIVKHYGLVVVGNARSSKLVKTQHGQDQQGEVRSRRRLARLAQQMACKAMTRGGMLSIPDLRRNAQVLLGRKAEQVPIRERGPVAITQWCYAARNILRVGLRALIEGARARVERDLPLLRGR
jgi:hypothetical protein